MKKTITIRPALFLLIIILYSFLPFGLGMICGSLAVDSDHRSIAVARVHNEMREAIRAGRSFFLKGSNIKIIPVSDKTVRVKVVEK